VVKAKKKRVRKREDIREMLDRLEAWIPKGTKKASEENGEKEGKFFPKGNFRKEKEGFFSSGGKG